MKFTAKELKERIEVRMKRTSSALNDKNVSDRIKTRLLYEEHAIYNFALKGLEPYLKEKANSSVMDPAQTVVPPTD